MKKLLLFVTLLLSIVSATELQASHIFGGDLLYTHISGNTYQVKLTLYGDCAGSAFQFFTGASPEIEVINGNNLWQAISLSLTGPGVNVTPVCPQQAANTQCDNINSTIPGVTRFIYSGNISLPFASADWKFRFEGQLNNHLAGRSNSITNILIGTNGSLMTLEASLNNLNFPNNSSPQYTTVPTPFFCINQPSSFNPGAVDPNGDSLTFALIDALEPTGTVNYINPYTGSSPVSGTAVSFNNSNGQFSFTPDITQISVVANEIKEYRNGILVGSSMREMNFVVQNNCNNTPPNGGITAPTGGTAVNNTFFRTCPAPNNISFQILPTDVNGDSINVSVAGIPNGAVTSLTNNNTPNPVFDFTWDLVTATPGTFYTIYLTYTDFGCPLSAKQTIAYTIYVLFKPDFDFNIITNPTCTKKAVYVLNPQRNISPYTVEISQGATILKNYTAMTNSVTDSLDPGTYNFNITDGYGCSRDTSVTIAPPPPIHGDILNLSEPDCEDDSTASFTAIATSGQAPFTYSLNGGPYTTTNSFSGLWPGTHTVSIKDANDCQLDTSVIINNAPPILINTTFQKPPCNSFQNGSITVVASNTTAPYTYSFNGGAFNTTNTFTNLYSGTYPLTVEDGLGCQKDFSVVLPDSIKIAATLNLNDILCYGDTAASISVNATNGFPPYMYSLNGGTAQSTNTFSPLTAGVYQVLVTDTEGCYWDTTITFIEPDSIDLSVTTVDPLCYNTNDGNIAVTATGGSAPYSYSLNGANPQPSPVFPSLPNGTYTITVEDANGCLKDIITTLASPPEIFGTVTVDSTTCAGNSDGSITVSGSGGVPPYTYSIGGGFISSGVFASLAGGTYTVSIRDANNCIKDTIVIVNDPQIIPTLAIDTPTCIGDTDGGLTVSAVGGTPAYTYSLSSTGPFQTSGVFTGLSAGTYTVYVRDDNNCIKDTTFNLPDPPAILIDTNFKKPPCNSFQNGQIEVIAYNSTGPYTYSLDGGPFQTSGVFAGLFSGTYTITVENALGCQADFTVILPDSIKIAATVNITDNPCYGDALGEIEVNASSGFPPYTYFLDANPPQTPNTFTGLPAGSYTVHVRDTENCYWDSLVIVTEPDSIQIIDSTIRLSCFQSNDGQAYFTVLGGTAPFMYSVDGGPFQNSSAFTGLAGGWHTIDVEDANACTNQDSFFVSEPDSLYLTYVPVNPSCYGSADGSITATGVGGTLPYNFSLNGGAPQSSGSFTGLVAGTYVLSIFDSSSCGFDTTIILTQPDSMMISSTVKNPLCATLANGEVTMTVISGGTGPYTYSFDGGVFTPNPTLAPVSSGPHIFTVMDANGCTKDTTITLLDSFIIGANINTSNALCNNTGSGWIQIEGTGGTPDYTYAINGTGFSPVDTFKNLFAGTHTVSTKDTFGCIFQTQVNLFQPNPVEIVPGVTDAQCHGAADGTITATGTNGTPPYTYSIDGTTFQTSGLFTGLAANTYTLTVMDDNGCTKDTIINITEPAPITMLIDAPSALCFGTASATVTVSSSQGTPPYQYQIDGGALQSSNTFVTTAGNHVINTVDANGCQSDTLIKITEPDPVSIYIDYISPSCSGFADGQVTVSGGGGVSNYTYSINGGPFQAYAVFQNLPEGSYTFAVRDSNNCTKDTSFTLSPTNSISVNFLEITGESCYDYKDGIINIVGRGQSPFKYHLRNYISDQSNGYFDNLETGNYTVTLEDAKGCTLDTNLYVPIPDKFEIELETVLNNCEMSGDEASITVLGTGGTLPYTYQWSTGDWGSTISNLANGMYHVMATDSNGCSDTDSATITYDNCCNPFVPNAFTPNNDGQNDLFEFKYNGDVELVLFQVFNRWGQVVFETDDINQGWDGKRNGKNVEVGVYFYKIKIFCGVNKDNIQELTGDLTLLR